MTEPFVVPEDVIDQARRIAVALQPHIEDLVVRSLTATYRRGFADGYLAAPSNLDAESRTDLTVPGFPGPTPPEPQQ